MFVGTSSQIFTFSFFPFYFLSSIFPFYFFLFPLNRHVTEPEFRD